jgi:two-component system cell cycle sensor histidine kinase/response regulator CckA
VAERTRELAAAIEELQKEIAECKYSERRLATQYAVTRVLAESDTLAAATPRLLRAIGESMEWGWGALWIVDPKAAVIHCQSIWHAPNIEAAEFDAISRETVFTPGRGVPGRVWQSGSPIWIDDATKNPVVVRAPVAARTDLHTAIAFPILLRGQTLGVIELFSHAVRQPDKEQLATLSALGNQIASSSSASAWRRRCASKSVSSIR